MTLSPTERQRARDLCEGPDWRVRTVIRELEGIVSAAPSSAAKKRTRTTVLYEALWASRGYDAARTLVPRLLAALEEHERANEQLVGQVVELTAEVAALKRGVRSLLESRKKWKRRAMREKRAPNALDQAEWEVVGPVPLPKLTQAELDAILAKVRMERLAREGADAELAEDRADYFASTEDR